MDFDFYLTHQMKETDYVKKWPAICSEKASNFLHS